MKFCIVDPSAARVEIVEANDLAAAYPLVGLKRGEVDFGTVYRDEEGWGISITVFQFGLFKKVEEAKYFSIGNQLYVDGAVLFMFNAEGDTVNWRGRPPPVMFYRDHHEVEAAIQAGRIRRPVTAINDEVLWRWPDAQR